MPGGADAASWVQALRGTAETVVAGPGPAPCATPTESELVLKWLESTGVRLIHVEGDWAWPVHGANRHLSRLDAIDAARVQLTPFDEQSTGRWRTEHQPPR
jgi:DNA polymerase-3 subunit epsilon